MTTTIISTMLTLGFSMASISVAIKKPLISLAGFYDLHLFPENDAIDYVVSETHHVSQIMHVVALMSMILSLGLLIFTFLMGTSIVDQSARRISKATTACIIFSSVSYFIAITTLLKVGLDYKKLGDDLPLVPKTEMEVGGIMDILGLFTIMVSASVMMITMMNGSSRRGSVRLG